MKKFTIILLSLLFALSAFAGTTVIKKKAVASFAVDDTFTTDTIANYTNISGTMAISGGKAIGAAWETNITYHETATGSNNHWVSGDCTAGAGDNSCLIVGSNGTQYYFIEISSGTIYIKSNADANWSTNYAGSYTNGTVYTVAVQIDTDGSSHARFNAWVGGTQVITNVSDTGDNVARGQYVGVRTKNNSTANTSTYTTDNLKGNSGTYTP
jgi:hypothetical protein